MGSLLPETIREQIGAKLSELGFELFDAKFFSAGSRAILRVTIDSPKGGVTISDCEQVSQALSLLLDVENFSAGRPYTLEVSSPGIDRPLSTEKDFKRTVGRFVVVQMAPEFEGKKTLRAKVIGCANGILTCEIDGAGIDLPLSLIVKGKEEIQFN